MKQQVIHGLNNEVLSGYPDNHFHSLVTDPPYGINFMGKHWDYDVPSVKDWKEIFRVLRPGAFGVVACGTRTQHRMVVNIEDAGFEVRDVICWHYGQGFPKSMDISKAFDKANEAIREKIGRRKHPTLKDTDKLEETANAAHGGNSWSREWDITASSSPEAIEWEGWGTALKPATELWTLIRKPLSEKTVVENIRKWGVGGINIDGCRVGDSGARFNGRNVDSDIYGKYGIDKPKEVYNYGRFPANIIHDGSEEVVSLFPNTKSGSCPNGFKGAYSSDIYGQYANNVIDPNNVYADQGSAARFFYCAKASTSERNKGLELLNVKSKSPNYRPNDDGTNGLVSRMHGATSGHKNNHPTVKPVSLMRYFVRLVTPKGGICLDPYNGSGTTGVGCKVEGIDYLGIEGDDYNCLISEYRIAGWECEVPEDNDKPVMEEKIKEGTQFSLF